MNPYPNLKMFQNPEQEEAGLRCAHTAGRSALQRELAEAVGGLMDVESIGADIMSIKNPHSQERLKKANVSVLKLRALAERKCQPLTPMILSELQAKLASGATPYLLSCKEAGISEGPWEVEPVHQNNNSGFRYWLGKKYAWSFAAITNSPEAQANARFIAATNGERPVCELLWKEYQYHFDKLIDLDFEMSDMEDDCVPDIELKTQYHKDNQHCIEILLFLSSAGRLGWVEKGE